YRFYRDTLGLPVMKEAVLADQGVRAALPPAGGREVELLQPLDPSNGVGRFLERRGEGLHHLCFETKDIAAALADLKDRKVPLLDSAPRRGLAGDIAFLHPQACARVLVEPATPHDNVRLPPAPLRLKRLVVGAADVDATVVLFQSLFGLPRMAMNGGPRTMLAVGR